MRRIIVGSTPSGRGVVVADEELVNQDMPHTPFVSVWGADAPPTLPSDGALPTVSPDFFPAPHGIRVLEFTVPPASEVPPAADDGAAETDAASTGPEAERAATVARGLRLVDGPPGMHQTDTVDLVTVVSGEMYALLDDGVEILLRPGDWIVQNGAAHAWENRSSVACVAVGILIGAHVQD